MTALLRRMPHMPGESLTSYASRLAACNGVDLPAFCRHMGVPVWDVVTGRRQASESLAALGGVPHGPLAADAIVRLDERRWSLRGQCLSSGTLRRLRPRFCPLCTLDDLEATTPSGRESAYGRSVWSVEPIRTCDVHHVVLSEPPDREGKATRGKGAAHDFATAFEPTLGMLHDLVHGLERRAPSAAEAYLLRRLECGVGGSPWLDSLDFDVASFVMEKLGAVAAFGRDVRYDHMSGDDLWFAGDVGFGLLEDGVAGLLRFCDMMQDTYRGSASGKEGPNSTYGRWWWHLNFEYRGPEFEPVMAPLREHVLARLPLEPGTRVLGHVVERRRMHSVRSAAREFGCRPSRLRHMLVTAGLLPPDQQRRRNALAVFDAEMAAPLLATIGERMRGTEAMTLLGVSSLKPFMVEGLLVPLTGYVRRKQRLYEFSRQEVHRFHHAMTHHLPEVDVAGPGKVPLYDAVPMLRRSIGKMSRLIRDGRAAGTCRMRGVQGLKAILVDLAEMRALLHHRSYDGLSVQLLTRRLQTKHETLVKLIDEARVFEPETLISPLSGHTHRVIPMAQIERFEAEYVSLSALARERSVHFLKLKRELVQRGIEPAFPPAKIGASIYLRSAVG